MTREHVIKLHYSVYIIDKSCLKERARGQPHEMTDDCAVPSSDMTEGMIIDVILCIQVDVNP